MTDETAPAAVLTIGHSNHSLARFVELLRAQQVTAALDVRSRPFSRRHPDFNRPALAEALRREGIGYSFLGDALGGRSDDPACYANGRVHYPTLARSAPFQSGLRRVIEAANSAQVALVCAEKEPLGCHRTLLIGRALTEAGVPVAHIDADGGVESQAEAMTRLLRLLRMPDADLFRSHEQMIEDALAKQSRRVAYGDERMHSASAGGQSEDIHHWVH